MTGLKSLGNPNKTNVWSTHKTVFLSWLLSLTWK